MFNVRNCRNTLKTPFFPQSVFHQKTENAEFLFDNLHILRLQFLNSSMKLYTLIAFS